jgi:phosphohistidine phosphatase
MDLFLIRHAIAQDRRPGLPDAERQLTASGRERFEAVVEQLRRAGLRFDRVYHSPWTRAVQTAELLSPLNAGSLDASEELAMAPEAGFFSALQGDSIACVGHEPWMSDAVALLTTGQAQGTWLRFKKGGVAWLSGEPEAGAMELRGFWAPKLLLSLR